LICNDKKISTFFELSKYIIFKEGEVGDIDDDSFGGAEVLDEILSRGNSEFLFT
jgi:hypothetical protein